MRGPTACPPSSAMVGTAQARLCPPYVIVQTASVTSAACPAPTVLDNCATRMCKLVCTAPKSASSSAAAYSACGDAHAIERTTDPPETISSAYASLSSPTRPPTPQPSPATRGRLIQEM